jgi:hypothetical protein
MRLFEQGLRRSTMNKAFATVAAASFALAFGATAVSAASVSLTCGTVAGCADVSNPLAPVNGSGAGTDYAPNYGAFVPGGYTAGASGTVVGPAPVATSGNSSQKQSVFFDNPAVNQDGRGYWIAGGTTGIGPTPAYLTANEITNTFTLLWGSIDTYNTISFLNSAGNVVASFTGTQVVNGATVTSGPTLASIASNPTTGAGNYNIVALLTFDLTQEGGFKYVQFESRTNAFEFALVPIPPAALLFGTALAGVGFMSRRKKAQAAA